MQNTNIKKLYYQPWIRQSRNKYLYLRPNKKIKNIEHKVNEISKLYDEI